MITFPREATRFVFVDITDENDDPVTTFEVCCVPATARPSGWTSAAELDSRHGILLAGLTAGSHNIWARVTANPETDVILCGQVYIT